MVGENSSWECTLGIYHVRFMPSISPSHRKANLFLLGFLICSCLFFSPYDLFHQKVWWSTAVIYLPCILVFGFGFLAWRGENERNLRIFGIILAGVELCLLGYGIWLWGMGEILWGPLTLGFAALIGGMLWSVLKAIS